MDLAPGKFRRPEVEDAGAERRPHRANDRGIRRNRRTPGAPAVGGEPDRRDCSDDRDRDADAALIRPRGKSAMADVIPQAALRGRDRG